MNDRTESLFISGIMWGAFLLIVILLASCGGWNGLREMVGL